MTQGTPEKENSMSSNREKGRSQIKTSRIADSGETNNRGPVGNDQVVS